VTIYSACCRSYDNRSTHELCGGLNIANDYVAFADTEQDMVEIQESIGMLKHAVMRFKPSTAEERDQFMLHVQSSVNRVNRAEIRFHYLNPDFITSTYRVNGFPLDGVFAGKSKEESTREEIAYRQEKGDSSLSSVLWNGIIHLPAALCEKAGLALYSDAKAEAYYLAERNKARDKRKAHTFGEEEEEDEDEKVSDPNYISEEERAKSPILNHPDDLRVRCWYAMDINHVLAWPLHTSGIQRRSIGIYAQRLDATIAKKRVPLCWLVPDTDLRGLMRNYNNSWANKVDTRTSIMSDVGITLAPLQKHQGTLEHVDISLRIVLKCIIWKENTDTFCKVAPKMHPDFPPLSYWTDSAFDEIDLSKLKI
jgi:hypothetical protein